MISIIREEFQDFSADPHAPRSHIWISITANDGWHNRAAYFIGGEHAQLMYAPLDGNDYPHWQDAGEVDTDLIDEWLVEIAERAELRVRTAEPCDECGTPAGQRSDDFGCQCNWW